MQPVHMIWAEELRDGRVIWMGRCMESRGLMTDGDSPDEVLFHLGAVHEMDWQHREAHQLPHLRCNSEKPVTVTLYPVSYHDANGNLKYIYPQPNRDRTPG